MTVKRKMFWLLPAMMIFLAGCGNTNSIGETGTMTDEELKKFSSGVSVEETVEEKVEEGTAATNTADGTTAENAEASTDEKDTKKDAEDQPAEETPADSLEEVACGLEGIVEFCPNEILTRQPHVDYGQFKHDTYYSETCGMDRGVSILLPSDYSEDKEYPVLYLLHGIFGDEYSFANDSSNKIKELLTNMEAQGYIADTILVCPNMYATSDPNQKPGFDAASVEPYDNFINDLVNDLMPYINSTYATSTDREDTYLAGFSMGGRETLYITLQRPELFGYVCAISAAPGITATTDAFMTHVGQLKEEEVVFAEDALEPEVFIVTCGTKDSVVGTYPKSYHELFEKNGVNHIWYEVTGADHDNNAIRSGLYNLLLQIYAHKGAKS